MSRSYDIRHEVGKSDTQGSVIICCLFSQNTDQTEGHSTTADYPVESKRTLEIENFIMDINKMIHVVVLAKVHCRRNRFGEATAGS